MISISYLIMLTCVMKKYNNFPLLQILSIGIKPIKQRWLPQGWVFNNHKKFNQIIKRFRINQIINLFNIIKEKKKSNLQVSLSDLNQNNQMIKKQRRNLNGEIIFLVNNLFSNHFEVVPRPLIHMQHQARQVLVKEEHIRLIIIQKQLL